MLSPTNRAAVAKAVTEHLGWSITVRDPSSVYRKPMPVSILCYPPTRNGSPGYSQEWDPQFKAEPLKRKQAFALVEWLAKWWVRPHGPGKFDTNFDGMARDIMVAINDSDVARLEQLVFELLEKT